MNCSDRTFAGNSPDWFPRSRRAGPVDAQLLRNRCPLTDRRRLHVDRELLGGGRKTTGPVGADEPGEVQEQRPVVLERLGHLVVQALVVLSLDPVGPKGFAQRSGFRSRVAVVVGELSGGPRSETRSRDSDANRTSDSIWVVPGRGPGRRSRGRTSRTGRCAGPGLSYSTDSRSLRPVLPPGTVELGDPRTVLPVSSTPEA